VLDGGHEGRGDGALVGDDAPHAAIDDEGKRVRRVAQADDGDRGDDLVGGDCHVHPAFFASQAYEGTGRGRSDPRAAGRWRSEATIRVMGGE
jgi:hypothetical protein